MGRNFLGIRGEVLAEGGETENGFKDAAGLANSGVQWPSANSSMTTCQQFVPLKSKQADGSKWNFVDGTPSTWLQYASAMDVNRRPSTVLSLQTNPYFDPSARYSNDGRAVPLKAYYSSADELIKAYNDSMIDQSNPSFVSAKNHQQQQKLLNGVADPSAVVTTSPVNSGFVPSHKSCTKPAQETGQMTIFYAGAVNVYDNVTVEKARDIMLLMGGGGSRGSSRAMPAPVGPAVLMPGKAGYFEVSCRKQNTPHLVVDVAAATRAGSRVSSPVSIITPRAPTPSTSTSSAPAGNKVVADAPPTTATVLTMMPRAVPMARKASLARFLERRKDRMASASCPYLSPQLFAESSMEMDATSSSSRAAASPQSAFLGTGVANDARVLIDTAQRKQASS